jgi:hypothetical protein
MINQNSKIIKNYLIYFCLIFFALLIPFVTNFIFINEDTMININILYRIREGQLPYIDFRMINGPIFYYILRIFSFLDLPAVITMSIITTVFSLLASYLNFKLIYHLTQNKNLGYLSLFLTTLLFIPMFGQIMEGHLCFIIINLCFYLYLTKKNNINYFIIGILVYFMGY